MNIYFVPTLYFIELPKLNNQIVRLCGFKGYT